MNHDKFKHLVKTKLELLGRNTNQMSNHMINYRKFKLSQPDVLS